MKIKFFLIFICIFISMPCTFAENTVKKISLLEALNLAVENNIDIKSARLDLEAHKNNIKIANRLQNPSIDVYYNYGKAGDGNPQTWGVSQVIELWKRGARKNLAKSLYEQAKEEYYLKEFNLKMQVRKAYIEYAAAQAEYNVLEDQRNFLKELLVMLITKGKIDETYEIEVLQTQISVNQTTVDLNNARAKLRTAIINFNKTLNLQDDEVEYQIDESIKITDKSNFITLLTPLPEFEMPPFKNICNEVLQKRFDLKIAKQEVDVAEKNLKTVARQRIPDLEVQGGYGYQAKARNDQDKFLSGAYAGASFTNIPLFYNYSPEIKNAKMELDKTRLRYQSTYNIALKSLSSAYEKFVAAQLNLNYYDYEILGYSDKLMEISKKSYEEGKSDLTALIVMEQSHLAIKTSYIEALVNYYTSWIDFLTEVNNEELVLSTDEV